VKYKNFIQVIFLLLDEVIFIGYIVYHFFFMAVIDRLARFIGDGQAVVTAVILPF